MGLESRTFAFESIDATVRERWSELTASTDVDLSMAPQWFESAVRSRGAVARAFVFAAYERGELVGLVPHILGSERILRLAARSLETPGSYLVSYHPEIICRTEPEALLEAYVEDAARRCDVLVFPNLPRNGRTAAAAFDVARRHRLKIIERAGHTSPYLTINSRWDEFLATKNKKFRYKVRTGMKSLEQAGEVRERWFSTELEIDELFDALLSIEENSWKVDAGMSVSASTMEREYYRLLLPFLAAHRALHANVIYLDSVPVAYSLCYVSGQCVRQLKTSYDQRHARLSPGAVCHQLSIRKAFEAGAREFDFLGDNMLHKSLWTNDVREHVTLYLFLPTWRGAALYGGRWIARSLRGHVRAKGASGAASSTADSAAGDHAGASA